MLIQNHQQTSQSDIIADLHQTPLWRAKYEKSGYFEGDPRGLSFALCTDGLNPFSKEKVTYSMWPITMIILNFPRNIQNTSMLVGIKK